MFRHDRTSPSAPGIRQHTPGYNWFQLNPIACRCDSWRHLLFSYDLLLCPLPEAQDNALPATLLWTWKEQENFLQNNSVGRGGGGLAVKEDILTTVHTFQIIFRWPVQGINKLEVTSHHLLRQDTEVWYGTPTVRRPPLHPSAPQAIYCCGPRIRKEYLVDVRP